MIKGALAGTNFLGRVIRYPLTLIPPSKPFPILMGRLRGKRLIIGSAIYRCWFGFYEYKKQKAICSEVKPGSVFFDIGAHVGFYSLLASELTGKGKVYAFEPAKRNLNYLKSHLALNKINNVEVFATAVGDTVGVVHFQSEDSGYMGRILDSGGTTVPITTLDSLIGDGRIPAPNYIKMDVEGAELSALHGAVNTFARYHPTLFLATHGRKMYEACCELLQSWRYECRLFEGDPHGDNAEIIARFIG